MLTFMSGESAACAETADRVNAAATDSAAMSFLKVMVMSPYLIVVVCSNGFEDWLFGPSFYTGAGESWLAVSSHFEHNYQGRR